MKHYWAEAAFVPDLTDADASLGVPQRFLELRDDDLGRRRGRALLRGLRRRRGEVLVGRRQVRHGVGPPRHPCDVPDDLDPSLPGHAVAALGSPFVTVDLAMTLPGRWRVVEVGDGQVSDRPASLPPELLLAALGQR